MAEPMKKRAPARRAPSRKAPATRMNDVHTSVQQSSVCHACNSLPAGSMELTALMLVLVFSLTAVLFTSVYALRGEQQKVAQLQEVVSDLHVE